MADVDMSISNKAVNRYNANNVKTNRQMSYINLDNKGDSFEKLTKSLKDVQNKQGFIGKFWNGFKNLTGLGLSSKDVENKIEQCKNGEITYEEAQNSIQNYETKQNSIVDIAANVVSGIVVAGTAVTTGGASLAAGAAIGGAVKAGIKTADRATNNVEGDAVDVKQITKDAVTGAVDGAVTVATAGMIKGPIVGQSVKEAVKTGVVQGAKAGAIAGAASGAASYTVEAACEDDVDFNVKEFVTQTAQNAAIGGVMGGALSGVSSGAAQAKFNTPEVVQLADNLHIQSGDVEGSDLLSDYLAKNKKVNISELNEYIDNVDIDNISKIAPQVENYTPKQLMNFYDYHYKAGTDVFDVNTLSLDYDLTEFLKRNYTNSEELSKLLDSMPASSREVGSLPQGWTANMTADESAQAAQKIYKAISNFRNSGNQDDFSKELSDALGQKVKIEELGQGAFGSGYKISTEGADDVVLKVFDQDPAESSRQMFNLLGVPEEKVEKLVKKNTEKLLKLGHGEHSETQAALFINEHSDDYVKMYFGKVAGASDKDGYYVTQFLDDTVTPLSTGSVNTGKYKIKSKDAWTGDSFKGQIFNGEDHNIINGKIIDFGGVKVKETGIKGLLSSIKSLFSAA